MKQSATSVSKIGFSKSSFGCCSRHFICEMGTKECFYQNADPEVPKLCAAYQRNHGKGKVTGPIKSTQSAKEIEAFNENLDGQLSLF